jgi:hypothetical protein
MTVEENGRIAMIRSILSVITGIVIFFIPVYIFWAAFGYGARDVPPDGFFAASVVLEIFLGFAAGYLTALLAGRRGLLLSCIVAGLLAFQNLGFLVAGPEGSPKWPYALSLLLVPPAVVLGGYLHRRFRSTDRSSPC